MFLGIPKNKNKQTKKYLKQRWNEIAKSEVPIRAEGAGFGGRLTLVQALHPPRSALFFSMSRSQKTLRIACFASLLQHSLSSPPLLRFTHVRLYPWVGVRQIPVHRCYWTVNTAGLQSVKDLRPIGEGLRPGFVLEGADTGVRILEGLKSRSVGSLCCPHGFPPD